MGGSAAICGVAISVVCEKGRDLGVNCFTVWDGRRTLNRGPAGECALARYVGSFFSFLWIRQVSSSSDIQCLVPWYRHHNARAESKRAGKAPCVLYNICMPARLLP